MKTKEFVTLMSTLLEDDEFPEVYTSVIGFCPFKDLFKIDVEAVYGGKITKSSLKFGDTGYVVFDNGTILYSKRVEDLTPAERIVVDEHVAVVEAAYHDDLYDIY